MSDPNKTSRRESMRAKRSELAAARRAEVKLQPTSKFRAVVAAVRSCRRKHSPERLIKVIGPTGAGKTTLRDYLVETLSDTMEVCAVESRDTWRPATRDLRARCKLVVLLDLFAAFGIEPEAGARIGDVPELEDELMAHLLEQQRVLFVDEAEFFSAYALNLFKLLLNQTRIILVVACTPRAHAKWQQWYPDEADQIARRTDATVSLEVITPEDLGLFFAETVFSTRPSALEFIAREASRFGHVSLVARIHKALGAAVNVTDKQAEGFVEKALREMGKKRMVSENRKP